MFPEEISSEVGKKTRKISTVRNGLSLEILGVSQGASKDEIKKAYLRLAKKYHPDRNKGDKSSQEKFAEINTAYETLGDAEKRKMYDMHGMTGDES